MRFPSPMSEYRIDSAATGARAPRCVAQTFASAACTARRSSTNETSSSDALTVLLIAERLQGERAVDLLHELCHARLGAGQLRRGSPETSDALLEEFQRTIKRDAGTRVQLGRDGFETGNIGFEAQRASSTRERTVPSARIKSNGVPGANWATLVNAGPPSISRATA